MMDPTRIYFPMRKDASEEDKKLSPEHIRFEKHGDPYDLYSCAKWSKSMDTLWLPPLKAIRQNGDVIHFLGQEVTIISIESVQYNGSWEIEYELQPMVGDSIKVLQSTLPL